jgi:hypothetical protein
MRLISLHYVAYKSNTQALPTLALYGLMSRLLYPIRNVPNVSHESGAIRDGPARTRTPFHQSVSITLLSRSGAFYRKFDVVLNIRLAQQPLLCKTKERGDSAVCYHADLVDTFGTVCKCVSWRTETTQPTAEGARMRQHSNCSLYSFYSIYFIIPRCTKIFIRTT